MGSTRAKVCPHCGIGIDEIAVDLPHRPDLLYTNEPPSDADFTALYDARARARDRVALLNKQISTMEKTLASRKKERDVLQTGIEEYWHILHPVRRIPVDIVEKVFLLLVDELPEGTGAPTSYTDLNSSLESRHMPWRLVTVSARWRAIALSYPLLWSFISVRLSTDHTGFNLDRTLTLRLSAQLQRSGTIPLSVSVWTDVPDGTWLSVLPVLLSSSPRWKRLTLLATPAASISLSPLIGCLNNLKTLHLTRLPTKEFGNLGNSILIPTLIPELFRDVPMLRKVMLRGDTSLQIPELPWSQILELDTDVYSSESFRSTLSLTPNLRSLICSISCFDDPRDSTLELKHLKMLRIDCNPGCRVLEQLVIPSLEVFHIDYRDSSLFRYTSLPSTILNSSRHALKTLKITAGTTIFNAEHYIKVLGDLIALQSLSIPPSIPVLADHLRANPSLVPALQELELGDSRHGVKEEKQAESSEALSQLIAARQGLRISIWEEKLNPTLLASVRKEKGGRRRMPQKSPGITVIQRQL